jgi:hypothetical protein
VGLDRTKDARVSDFQKGYYTGAMVTIFIFLAAEIICKGLA